MSTHITDMSEFFDAQMTRGHKVRVMSWNILVLERMSSTCELVMGFEMTLMLGLGGLK